MVTSRSWENCRPKQTTSQDHAPPTLEPGQWARSSSSYSMHHGVSVGKWNFISSQVVLAAPVQLCIQLTSFGFCTDKIRKGVRHYVGHKIPHGGMCSLFSLLRHETCHFQSCFCWGIVISVFPPDKRQKTRHLVRLEEHLCQLLYSTEYILTTWVEPSSAGHCSTTTVTRSL